MTEAAHTPGPWAIVDGELRNAAGTRVVEACAGIAVSLASPTEEAFANGRLRNAAPELLAALKELCDQLSEDEQHGDGAFDPGCSICIAHADARAAISKALGAA